MAGNHNSGRKRADDPKYVKSVRFQVSTLTKISVLSDVLGVEESTILQNIVKSGVDSLYDTILSSKKRDQTNL